MINEKYVKKYCKEDLSKIENYDKAIADVSQMWECHHRDEVRILPSGIKVIRSRQELIENERYYNCHANELIFLTREEHKSLHHKGKSLSDETCRKMSETRKGKTTTIFGKTFKEHYGFSKRDDKKLYMKEYKFYKYHGKFSWDVNNDNN